MMVHPICWLIMIRLCWSKAYDPTSKWTEEPIISRLTAERCNANRRITDAYEGAHAKVQRLLGAQSAREIIFVHGATEGINLSLRPYVFSGHKLFGPTGIGALYGKLSLLEDMPPWQGGGSMIERVTFEATTYNKVPAKFEAGTRHIAGAVGLGAAIDYLERIDFEAANRYEQALTTYASEVLATIPQVRQIGTAPQKVGVLSFVLAGAHPEAVGQFLDEEGIAV